jgi:hypothetical protein
MRKENIIFTQWKEEFTSRIQFEIKSRKDDYSDESEHPIPTKVDSRFDDDFLG